MRRADDHALQVRLSGDMRQRQIEVARHEALQAVMMAERLTEWARQRAMAARDVESRYG